MQHIKALARKGLRQQEGFTITGKVTDETGEPLAGANVIVLGTNRGTTTDFDGIFTISVNKNEILKFSYIGYESYEYNVVSSKSDIEIILKEKVLEEVVVTAVRGPRCSECNGELINPYNIYENIPQKKGDISIIKGFDSENNGYLIGPSIIKEDLWFLSWKNPLIIWKYLLQLPLFKLLQILKNIQRNIESKEESRVLDIIDCYIKCDNNSNYNSFQIKTCKEICYKDNIQKISYHLSIVIIFFLLYLLDIVSKLLNHENLENNIYFNPKKIIIQNNLFFFRLTKLLDTIFLSDFNSKAIKKNKKKSELYINGDNILYSHLWDEDYYKQINIGLNNPLSSMILKDIYSHKPQDIIFPHYLNLKNHHLELSSYLGRINYIKKSKESGEKEMNIGISRSITTFPNEWKEKKRENNNIVNFLKNISKVHTTNIDIERFFETKRYLHKFKLNIGYNNGEYKNTIKNIRLLFSYKYGPYAPIQFKYHHDFTKEKNYYFGGVDSIIHRINHKEAQCAGDKKCWIYNYKTGYNSILPRWFYDFLYSLYPLKIPGYELVTDENSILPSWFQRFLYNLDVDKEYPGSGIGNILAIILTIIYLILGYRFIKNRL